MGAFEIVVGSVEPGSKLAPVAEYLSSFNRISSLRVCTLSSSSLRSLHRCSRELFCSRSRCSSSVVLVEFCLKDTWRSESLIAVTRFSKLSALGNCDATLDVADPVPVPVPAVPPVAGAGVCGLRYTSKAETRCWCCNEIRVGGTTAGGGGAGGSECCCCSATDTAAPLHTVLSLPLAFNCKKTWH